MSASDYPQRVNRAIDRRPVLGPAVSITLGIVVLALAGFGAWSLAQLAR